MKTTVEIADGLLNEAKALAAREKTTLRRLIHDGLRLVIEQRRSRRKKKFKLRDASFKGEGLKPGLTWDDMDNVRDIIYGDPREP